MNKGHISDLLSSIGGRAGGPCEAWLIGGASLVVAGIQEKTKDVDLLFSEECSRAAFVERAAGCGFVAIEDPAATAAGGSTDRSATLLGPENTIIDCFLRITTHFSLTSGLRERSIPFIEFNRGFIRRVIPQDIFVLKSATGRQSDAFVAQEIVKNVALDWSQILEALTEQEAMGNMRAMYDMSALLTEAGLWGAIPAKFATELVGRLSVSFERLANAAAVRESRS